MKPERAQIEHTIDELQSMIAMSKELQDSMAIESETARRMEADREVFEYCVMCLSTLIDKRPN